MKKILIDASSLLNLYECGMIGYLSSLPLELFTTNLEFDSLPSDLHFQLESSNLKIINCAEELQEYLASEIMFTNSYLFSDKLLLLYGIKHGMTIVSDEPLIQSKARDHGLTSKSVTYIMENLENEKIATSEEFEEAIKLLMNLYPSIIST